MRVDVAALGARRAQHREERLVHWSSAVDRSRIGARRRCRQNVSYLESECARQRLDVAKRLQKVQGRLAHPAMNASINPLHNDRKHVITNFLVEGTRRLQCTEFSVLREPQHLNPYRIGGSGAPKPVARISIRRRVRISPTVTWPFRLPLRAMGS